jgi:protein CpxP
MKRWTFGIVVVAIFAGAAFAITDAQERAGRQPGGFGPPRFGMPGHLGFAQGRPMALGRIADLTDAQREQIKTILDEQRQTRQGRPAAMDLHRQLRVEVLADAPDDQKIETLRQQIVQATADSLAREIGLQRKIAQVLTPEQRAKAREGVAQERLRRGR